MALIPFGVLSAGAGIAVVSKFAYFGGGNTGASVVDKLNFTAETVSTLATGLSANSTGGAGFANSNVAGYFAHSSGAVVNKFSFADDSRTTLATGMSVDRGNISAFANSGVAGYVSGGVNTSSVAQSLIDKFAFPTDTRSTLNLPAARWTHGGMSNNGVAGYTGGGIDASMGGQTDTVYKVAFPGDSTSTLGTGLSSQRFGVRGFNNAGVAGYFPGGQTAGAPFLVATVDKFAFPSDTRSTGPTLSLGKRYGGGAQNSGTAGYYAGGESLGGDVATIDKFAFPSDTRTSLAAGLSAAKRFADGASNEGVL